MCLRNGREWTDKEGMNGPFVKNVAENEGYGEVPYVRVLKYCHARKTQRYRGSDGKRTGTFGRKKKTAATFVPSLKVLIWAMMHLIQRDSQDRKPEKA